VVQAEQDRKILFRRFLRRLGGVSEDSLASEFKKLLVALSLDKGISLYTLRTATTTAMLRGNVPHLELRYLTGHSTNDILNTYTSLDPTGAMQRYFDTIRPLLSAIADRAAAVGLIDHSQKGETDGSTP
jgi:site-specific recombinase XerD